MEAKTLILPENSVVESPQPGPFEFPKPDFTEIVQDYDNSSNEKPETPLLKPTFKNALQAKKRLQAFSSTRPNSLPSSPKKVKLNSEEKSEENKKTKKGNSHDDKAKAVIEEIEELKREELAYLRSHKRSRSRSNDKGRFKKVKKKSRNYRTRSISPDKARKSPKKIRKYPRNWHEFHELNVGFDINKDFHVVPPVGNNELLRQLHFESPSLQIIPFKMKTVNRDEKIVPFEYVRYTRTKPSLSYSVNFGAIKEVNLSRKIIFDALPKNVASIENLYSNSIKFATIENDSKVRKSKSWYPKNWKDSENECKVLEKSVSLSFLQTYTGEDEENDVIEEEEELEKIKKTESKHEKTDSKKDHIESSNKTKLKHKDKKKQDEKKKKARKVKEKKSKRSKEKKLKSKKDKIKKHDENEEKIKKKEESKEVKAEKQETRKRKHSDRDEENKRSKVEKREENEAEAQEHALKNKLENVKNFDLNIVKLENEAKFKDLKKSEENVAMKKSRWSETTSVKNEINCIKEKISEETFRNPDNYDLEDKSKETKDTTPDTDEYHSHWESDDDVSSSLTRQSLKLNRSWESDEELFERSQNIPKKPSETYTNLEIPLNIKNFSRRVTTWEENSFSVLEEFKRLEEERRTLSEERKKLELEKQRILKLQEEAKNIEEKKFEDIKGTNDEIKVKKEKCEMSEFSIDSLNNSLSNVSSGESSFPIAALENEYEEFMKAVSSESVVKKKVDRTSSESSSSSSSSSDSDHKKKKRKSRMKKKKKKKKRECEGLLVGKGNNIFNEFDIPVPSDLPEIVPTPVPVPSPILPLDKMIPLTAPNFLLNQEKSKSDEAVTKPFVFSSIVLPNKKLQLVDNSQLKLDDDSDTEDFPVESEKKPEEQENDKPPPTEALHEEKIVEMKKADPPSKSEESKGPLKEAIAPPPKSVETKRSRSKSPPRKSSERSRDRRRSLSKRRSPARPPPSRRRHPSPRRRTPPRRRGSPWRRSPSPRRRSPRRRRRTPSLSPPRSRGGARKRTPSPKRRASPLHSPLDGFKRSVADSTISDDMLPQPNPEDYNESPNSYGGGIKYYDRKKRSSLSPQLSPRRISLDDRINQVLGLKENDLQTAPLKMQDSYSNYYNNPYGQQYQNYNQFPPPKNDYGPPPYGQIVYNQPPPNIVKPIQTPTKVVQVGNILQVVPTEELPVLENKPQESSQKILQVGNMLQIVPGVMPTVIPEQILNPVHSPEKQSAEALMKQKTAERKAEREKRRQERERRRKEKEKKRKEREKRKQLKLKLKTENMIKKAIQLEAEALANEDVEEEGDNAEQSVQWPSVPVIVSTPPNCKSILLQGGSKQRKSVQFADGIRPGEGTSPSGGEELSSPPPRKLPKEKRFKKLKIPKKTKKKVKVKVVKVQNNDEEDEDDEEDNLPPPSPPPGSPPPHVFPSRVKTHTINNVHQFVGNIIQSNPAGFPFRTPMPVVMNRHQQGPTPFIGGNYPTEVNSLQHPTYQGISSHH